MSDESAESFKQFVGLNRQFRQINVSGSSTNQIGTVK